MNAFSIAVVLVPLFFIGTVLLWLKTAEVNSELLKAFIQLMPQEAYAVAPELFSDGRDPRKAFFFFTTKAARVIATKPSLLYIRRRFIRLAILSITLPVSLVVCAAVFVLSYG
jgi:hypothetical protein